MAKYDDGLIAQKIKSKVKGAYDSGKAVDHMIKSLESSGFLGDGVKMTDMMKDQLKVVFDEILNDKDGYLDAIAVAVGEAVAEVHSIWQKQQQVTVLLDAVNVLINPGIATAGAPTAQSSVAPGTGSVINPKSTGAPGIALPE